MRLQHFLTNTALEVPHIDAARGGAGEYEARVEGEADAGHGARALEQQYAVANLHVPHAGGTVGAASNEVHRVGGERHTGELVRMTSQRKPRAPPHLLQGERLGNQRLDGFVLSVTLHAVPTIAGAGAGAGRLPRRLHARLAPRLVAGTRGSGDRDRGTRPRRPVPGRGALAEVALPLCARLRVGACAPAVVLAASNGVLHLLNPPRNAWILPLHGQQTSNHLCRQHTGVDVRQAAADAHLESLQEQADFGVGGLEEEAAEVDDGGGDAVGMQLLLQPKRVRQQRFVVRQVARLGQVEGDVVHKVAVVRDVRHGAPLLHVHLQQKIV
mmetsp:Transcript_18401/g.32766  ORF Transcript_18401/g.32766 Transcript_18401/m.32766 type:complete len:327 (+) Transcript_18401:1567-2547(+)